jgi:hypothetical protein
MSKRQIADVIEPKIKSINNNEEIMSGTIREYQKAHCHFNKHVFWNMASSPRLVHEAASH